MIKSFIIAFSTYSKLPMPQIEWDAKSMKYSLCFFPFVGVVIGLANLFCLLLLQKTGFGTIAVAVALTLLPIIINGGIHLDGYIDTVDALSSWKSKAERLEILKDPHTGAFAIIYAMVYFLADFGLLSEISLKSMPYVAIGYAYSRILSALAVVTLKKAKKDGMVATSADSASKNVKLILILELIFCLGVTAYFNLYICAIFSLAGLLGFWCYKHTAYKYFGGITGDTAGFFLQVFELFLLACVVVFFKF